LPVFDGAFCSKLSVCSYLSICVLDGRLQLFIRMLDVHLQLTIPLQLSIRMLDIDLQLTIHLQQSIRMLDVHLQLTIHICSSLVSACWMSICFNIEELRSSASRILLPFGGGF
jgi:hypothetical protein